MNANDTGTPAGPTFSTMSVDDFDTVFGLEGNNVQAEADAGGAGDDGLLDDVLDLADGHAEIAAADDNVELAAARAARSTKRESREDERRRLEDERLARVLDDLPSNGEEDPAADDDDDVQAPPVDGDDVGGDGELTEENAQVMLAAMLEKFPGLKFTYKANGQDVEAAWSEVRDRAAGYMGQDAVHRTFEEAKAAKAEAERRAAEAETVVKAAFEDLRGYLTEDHRGFVDNVALKYGGVDGLRKLVAEGQQVLNDYEENPALFEMRRGMTRMSAQVGELLARVNGSGTGEAARSAEPAQQPSAPADIPEDFGFVPGRGYPQDFQSTALVALRAASKVAGLDVAAVVAAWDQEGRARPVFEVLDTMRTVAAADEKKKKLAATPPTRDVRGAAAATGRAGGGGKRSAAQAGGMPTNAQMMAFYKALKK